MFTEGFEFEEDGGEEYLWDLGDSVEWATGSEVRENFLVMWKRVLMCCCFPSFCFQSCSILSLVHWRQRLLEPEK